MNKTRGQKSHATVPFTYCSSIIWTWNDVFLLLTSVVHKHWAELRCDLCSVLKFFNPLAFLRASGPLGPRLMKRARPDIFRKYQDVGKNLIRLVPSSGIFQTLIHLLEGRGRFLSKIWKSRVPCLITWRNSGCINGNGICDISCLFGNLSGLVLQYTRICQDVLPSYAL
jgi:hypothetical protein